ncbi:MAG: hypothetical protein AAB437_02255 [Patescibacteria group bacterium]
MKEICANCVWFRPEPATPINPNAPVVKEQEIKKRSVKKSLLGGAVGLQFMENVKQFFKTQIMKPKYMILALSQTQIVQRLMI